MGVPTRSERTTPDAPRLGATASGRWWGTAEREDSPMASMDEAKGRAKEAAGDLTDNDDLKREGKTDQAKGKVKEGVDRAADAVKDVIK